MKPGNLTVFAFTQEQEREKQQFVDTFMDLRRTYSQTAHGIVEVFSLHDFEPDVLPDVTFPSEFAPYASVYLLNENALNLVNASGLHTTPLQTIAADDALVQHFKPVVRLP